MIRTGRSITLTFSHFENRNNILGHILFYPVGILFIYLGQER